MKVLIADDEQHIRNGLKASIDWNRVGVEEIFGAQDGVEALEICERERPEIILTDIRMPGIDGLELAKKATECYGTKKVLIMSGYSEFTYAQSAIRLGAVDYLLKPIHLEEVEEILEEIVKKISEEEKKEELLYQDILRDVVQGNVSMEEVRENIPKACKNAGEIFCVLLKPVQIYAGRSREELMGEASHMIPELEQKGFMLLAGDRDELVFMWKAESYPERSMYRGQILSSLSSVCKRDGQWAAGVSVTGSFRDIHALYGQAGKALDYLLYRERERIIFYEEFMGADSARPGHFSWEKVKEQIKELQMEDVRQVISAAFERFRADGCLSRGTIQEFCITFKNLLLDILQNRGMEVGGIMEKNSALFEKQLDYDVLSSYENWLQDCCYLVLKGVTEIAGKQYHGAVRRAMAYVNEYYSRDITLALIAEEVQKSTNYFCYMFKKDTGMNFNEYLNSVRIAKAKELLKTEKYMAYEVSDLVGYHDYAYFAKVFKRMCGCSPSEYKE